MNWEEIANFYERQEYRKNELRSFVKSCKKIITTNSSISNIDREEELLLKIKYQRTYIKLLDYLYEVLYYGDEIRRAIRYKLQELFNILDQKPFNELREEDRRLLNWSLDVLGDDVQAQNVDFYTKLDVQSFSEAVEELLEIISH